MQVVKSSTHPAMINNGQLYSPTGGNLEVGVSSTVLKDTVEVPKVVSITNGTSEDKKKVMNFQKGLTKTSILVCSLEEKSIERWRIENCKK